ncbi:MAG: hypothetical protein Q8K60_08955 [Parachlamydiaceae bacterium]|nr:hypothetical protein [Parachlamydiaceae bacterium]
MDFNNANYYLKNIEYGFGVAAVVPGLSIPAAIGQALLGKTQIIGGLSLAAFYSISSLFQRSLHAKKEENTKAIYSLTYVKHGALNLGRSIGTILPYVRYILLVKDGIDVLKNKEKYRKFEEVNNAKLVYQFNKFFSQCNKNINCKTNYVFKTCKELIFNNNYFSTQKN